jgi:DNA-binding transcriptional LysR family regulator
MQSLDIRSLEIFRAVAAEGSISKAARKLSRVQSNVSTRIKQLELRLGRTLFHRRKRGLDLTPDGELLLSYANRLIELSAEATEALSDGRPRGLFQIGTMESTAASRLPKILSRYHAAHPDVEIELATDTAGGLIERLIAFDVDVAFIAEPVAHERIENLPVFEEELALVVPRSFPPLDNVKEISGRTVVAFEQGCAYRRYLEDWLLKSGVVPGGILSLGSYSAILASVSAGTGYAVVPQSVLDTVSVTGDVRIHPLANGPGRIKTLLSWRANYRSSKLDALKDLLPTLATAQHRRLPTAP